MKKRMLALTMALLVAVTCFAAFPASAVGEPALTLSIEYASNTANPGDTVTATVYAQSLAAGTTTLAGFDLQLVVSDKFEATTHITEGETEAYYAINDLTLANVESLGTNVEHNDTTGIDTLYFVYDGGNDTNDPQNTTKNYVGNLNVSGKLALFSFNLKVKAGASYGVAVPFSSVQKSDFAYPLSPTYSLYSTTANISSLSILKDLSTVNYKVALASGQETTIDKGDLVNVVFTLENYGQYADRTIEGFKVRFVLDSNFIVNEIPESAQMGAHPDLTVDSNLGGYSSNFDSTENALYFEFDGLINETTAVEIPKATEGESKQIFSFNLKAVGDGVTVENVIASIDSVYAQFVDTTRTTILSQGSSAIGTIIINEAAPTGLTSTEYVIKDDTHLILCVSPGTTISAFKLNVEGDDSASFFAIGTRIAIDSSLYASTYVTTGMIVDIDGDITTTQDQYAVVIFGDIFADGLLDIDSDLGTLYFVILYNSEPDNGMAVSSIINAYFGEDPTHPSLNLVTSAINMALDISPDGLLDNDSDFGSLYYIILYNSEPDMGMSYSTYLSYVKPMLIS